ncbi:hypothetical protein TSUD_327580 [Trifolium subterraneum]|uniref:UBX domain-containing protein n=1 Tax=Trifolium subterraneum TaxID=3900 RepID=A0A2Z6P7N2_TRISU|nr:hypothetical protein TSUD_327580 [Trifolium subterraneum]
MAEEQAPASTSNVDGDDYAWVADEPRTTISKFSLNGGDGMFRTVQRPSMDDWKACIPNTSRRICSKFQWGSFPMYQIAFEHMEYRLPFSDFEVAVFRYLHLTPSQLHPNSLAFIRAFEMTAAYLGFMPTIPLFFHAFHLQRSRPKGDAANKFGWVSLKQSVKLFEMFLESVRGFKDSYFFVKPLNSVSWQSVIYRGPANDATGAQLVCPDGRPVMEDYSRFPLSWRKSHYLKPASDFIYSAEELTVEELSNYEQMKVFVSGFPRKYYEDEDGNPVLDEMGVPVTKKTFIDTKKLLASKNVAEMEACFSMLVMLYFIFVVYIYEFSFLIAFEHMGYILPFSDFEVAVFRYLHLTPSQLHPNSLAFIRAFEMTAAYLGFMPTIPLFFHAFHLQRSRPKGHAANKFGWVSLKQSVKLFEMFLESIRSFKDSYFFVKPLNSVSWQSVIYRGPAKDATGAQLVCPDGRPVMEDYSRFPLSWRKSHYLKPASDFIYSAEELTVEELSNYEQMKVFVSGFPRKYYEDEDGNPVLDEMGVSVTKKTFIDTKKLLASKNVAEMEACFTKLRKSKAAKEKRQAAVLGSSSTAAPSPGGDDIDNARGNTVIVDLEDTVANADNQSRPAKIARVDQGNTSATGQILPTSSKFVLPPAIGSPDLVRKSPVALSDAEKAIMSDMGPEALKNELADAMVAAFKLMEISSLLNGRECKYLEERDAAREEAVLANQKLEQARVNHAAYKGKYTLQAGLVTKLAEKETEAVRLVGEKVELEGKIKDLTTEKETLEGKMRDLESRPCSSGTAPDADELVVDSNGEYKGFTRAALVSRIFELEAQQLDIAKSCFDNAVAQLMVLNPGADLVVADASELKEVHDGVIVSPPPEEED